MTDKNTLRYSLELLTMKRQQLLRECFSLRLQLCEAKEHTQNAYTYTIPESVTIEVIANEDGYLMTSMNEEGFIGLLRSAMPNTKEGTPLACFDKMPCELGLYTMTVYFRENETIIPKQLKVWIVRPPFSSSLSPPTLSYSQA